MLGLGKKKSPIMLLQWQVCLGRGTSKSLKQPKTVQKDQQKLNLNLGLICSWSPKFKVVEVDDIMMFPVR